MTEFLLYLYAESPVHTGAADSVDVLDLPVQREAATGYPVIWGQSLKGALRQAARDRDWGRPRVEALFGSAIEDPGDSGATTPGLLAVGDAQLVAMPVPTLRCTFAWLTSDLALGRLARKYFTLHRAVPAVPQVAPDAGLATGDGWTASASEVLGPLLVSLGNGGKDLADWAKRIAEDGLGPDDGFAPFAAKLRDDLVLGGSSVTPTLLAECTEQAVRVQLDPAAKTVKNGPFYSEYLPAETILAASLTLRGNGAAHSARVADVRELLHGKLLRIGGDETLGKGLMWGRLVEAARSEREPGETSA